MIRIPKPLRAAALAGAVTLATGPAAAEDFQGSTIEARVLVGFDLDATAVAARLPDGWAPVTLPRGPMAGSNVILSLIDRHLIRDAEGNPADPAAGLAAAVIVYGVQPDTPPRLFVVRVFEPEPMQETYGNSVAASVTRESETSAGTDGHRSVDEEWTIRTAGGAAVLRLTHAGIPLAWSTENEARPFSAADPEFGRIYRYDHLAGLVMNPGIGREIDGAVDFVTDAPELADLFGDGAVPVAVVTIPVYLREVYLP